MIVSVDANLFRLAYRAVSTEQTRYYLNGVHIAPHPQEGAFLVSTDGHRMIVIHDPKGVAGGAVIVKLPRFALAECKPQKMFGITHRLVVNTELDSATVEKITPDNKKVGAEPKVENVLTVHKVIIDGTFPEWQRVVPSAPENPARSQPTAFNPAYLRDWSALGMEISKTIGGSGALHIALSDGVSPVIVRYASADNIFGIQMPLRSKVRGEHLPAFMPPRASATLQAAE